MSTSSNTNEAVPVHKQKLMPAYERLGRLVFMLLHNRNGYTKSQIFQYLAEYYPLNPGNSGSENREKQFDRDRQTLADQGVIIESLRDEFAPVVEAFRYRIDPQDFQFPTNIVFTPEEISLLDLAGQTWTGSELSAVSSGGIHRVRTLNVDAPDPVIGVTPSLNIPIKPYQVVQDAIDANQAISFSYLKALATEAEQRTVEPLVIIQFHGEWLLYAFDVDRADFRNFRLDRIVAGKVKQVHPKTQHPDPEIRAKGLLHIQSFFDNNIARLQVVPNSLAEKSLSPRSNRTENNVFEVNFLDVDSFAAELRYFGADVFVESPELLQNAVITGLKNALATCAEGSVETI